ncbi:MAG: hypothetical protein IT324_22615 [Anaerolineae bacterium]|nr:hypothetical protein [Anaerolineae bacterium]
MFILWIALSLSFFALLLIAAARFLIVPALAALLNRNTPQPVAHTVKHQPAKLTTMELARISF